MRRVWLKAHHHTADSTVEMTTIRTTCPRCGEVDMGPEAILLSVQQDGGEGCYRFTCPSCADDVEKRADRKIVALLISAGVDIEQPDLGAMAGQLPFDQDRDRPGTLSAAPFTIDDVIEFHFLLEDDRYIEDFVASSGGA